MLRFLKKHRKPSQKPVPSEDRTRCQTTDVGTENGRGSGDANHRGGSRIENQDGRVGGQQLPALDASTLTATLQGRRHTHRGSMEGHSEQLGHNVPGLQRDSNTHNQREHEGHGPDVQQRSEAAFECTSGGGQNDGDHDDPVQSGRSRVKEKGRVDRALGRAAFAVELAKGPAEAFTPLKAVLESISGVYAQYQNSVGVKDKIELLCLRITTLEKLFGQPTSDEKETKLREGLSMKLQNIEGQLRSLRGKSASLRFLDNAQDGEDVRGLLEDLQEAVNDYMMVQQMAIYDQGCKIMDAAEKSALNNFRSARGAEYRHGERKSCLKGTRGAVLDAIEFWARVPGRSPVYWLNGLAGTGKSTIAKTVAERLFADGQLGASFFCSRDFEDRKNLQLIFPTLATQLARKYTGFRSIITPLIQSDPNIAFESLYNQMEKLIVQPLHESGISTVIVIDALDECDDEESASAILSILGRLVSEIPKVKFFLTGRPEPHISVGFRLPLLAKMTDVFVLHEVEPDQVGSDIRLFFKTSFLELMDRRYGLDNWPTEEQLDRLCERAAGLFVYAAATLKFIDNKRREPRKQLDLILQSQKIGAREGKSLDSLYTSILQEGFDDDDPEYDTDARSVLGAVVLAANPLSPSAIAMLLGFNAEDISPLLSSVNSLLITQEGVDHPVRPFHKSFPDFITDPTRCTNPRFHISPPDHHARLLIGCLGLMNRTLEKNMCKLPEAVANSDVGDLKERTEQYINPALRYACMSWHTHLVGLIDADTNPAHAPTIIPMLDQFLKTKLLVWLEVLSVLGAVRNAVEALQVTTNWLEESSTLDLVDDCLLFAAGYFEIISASSQHIYHTALIMTPEDSIVWKLYKSHARPFIRVVHGGAISWDPSTAAPVHPSGLKSAVWSPCNQFIAVTHYGDTTPVDILDSATLQQLQTLEFPQGISTEDRTLIFSPDSRILTCSGRDGTDSRYGELFVVHWDLQTGGVASVIKWEGPSRDITGTPSVTYSASGKMVGISFVSNQDPNYSEDSEHSKYSDIFIYDVASGVLTHSHSLNDVVPLSNLIWTHGESLRFATADTTSITILQVGFTSSATPTEVETLPAPGGFGDGWRVGQLHPDLCRLAFASQDKILVWDARESRYLLESADIEFGPSKSFSSDGHFFACSTGPYVYLWKESPTGYILHRILATRSYLPAPLFAPNGESIVTFDHRTMRLWRARSFTAPPSSIPTQALQRTEKFILEFSPDGMFAVFAMRKDNTVTVLNLRSGVPQLIVDASMEVYGLGVVGNTTVVVIGSTEVITWDLPAGDSIPGALVGLKDSSRTIKLDDPPDSPLLDATVSSDSRHIALTNEKFLYMYRGSTGELLWKGPTNGRTFRFSPDGCHVWLSDDKGEAEVWRVDSGQEVLEDLGLTVGIEHPPEGYPWGSSRGYRVTDGWILGPDKKRLLLLPPPWQSNHPNLRVWKGKFLALLHGGLLEPGILELEINSDL